MGLGGRQGSALQSLKSSHGEQGSANSACKGPAVIGFVGLTISVAKTGLCWSTELAVNNLQGDGRGCISANCSLQKLVAGWISPNSEPESQSKIQSWISLGGITYGLVRNAAPAQIHGNRSAF